VTWKLGIRVRVRVMKNGEERKGEDKTKRKRRD